jgi:hypothetical protein
VNIFDKQEQKSKLDEEIRQAQKSVAQQKRINRDLKKVQSGGRVSSFLKRQAANNEVLSASVNLATASDPLSLGQALVQYQNTINDSEKDFFQRERRQDPKKPNEIPPPPESGTHVLGAIDGVVQWIATEDC